MKVCLFSYFVVLSGFAILTQQPAPWRPSIANDNKAATLDDTLKFVLGTANDTRVNRVYAPEDQKNPAIFGETFGVVSASKCSLGWSELYLVMSKGRYPSVVSGKTIADLSKVDPLSIVVFPKLIFGFPHGFAVVMEGTSGSEFAESTSLYMQNDYAQRFNGDLSPEFISEGESASCTPGDKKCSVKQTKETRADLFLPDQEAAHRVAQALMHAALLCGGKKAVSPF
jgi:hypothetical protein